VAKQSSMETRTTTSSPETGPGPRLGRRGFLGMVGVGVGTLAVAGVGGLTWKAVEGGVFATGTGPAYAAWDALDAPGDATIALVSAAVLAANAHNTQPWLFRVTPDRIDLFADMTRTIGAMDPLRRELDISLGCALENLVLAGPAHGAATTVTLLPEPSDPTHIARIDLTATAAAASPLYAAIANRHTNRGAYDTSRPVAQAQLDALGALVDAPGAELVWFTSDAEKAAFGELTLRATEAIIADRQQSTDDYVWYRSSWDEIQTKKDGITIDPSGQTPLIRALSKIVPVTQQQNNDGWLTGDAHDPDPDSGRVRCHRGPRPRRPHQPTRRGTCLAAHAPLRDHRGPGTAAPVPGPRTHRPRDVRRSPGRLHARDGRAAAVGDPRHHDVPDRAPDHDRATQSPPARTRRRPLTATTQPMFTRSTSPTEGDRP
jgi:hypothetical protein